jgi:EAL domain-containing protein (putative c-di-GMP-specific phosphodiesterase class I)
MPTGCQGCKTEGQRFDLAMAFQPIVDAVDGRIFAYEALVRGPGGEPAAEVIGRVEPEDLYAFDQQCRVKAIEGAVAAGILDGATRLSINFLPNAVYSPLACIERTLRTARATHFPTDRLIFEFTEKEEMADTDHVKNKLIRGIDHSVPRQRIVEGLVRMADALGIGVIAEGVETVGEYAALRQIGIRLMQGYLLARPGFRSLPGFTLPPSG